MRLNNKSDDSSLEILKSSDGVEMPFAVRRSLKVRLVRPRSDSQVRKRLALLAKVSLFFLFCIALGYTCTAFVLILHDDSRLEHAANSKRESTQTSGNSEVASDLYGLGVRLGFYIQSFTNILFLIKVKTLKPPFASGSIFIALLICWTIADSKQQISPCESWVVHNLYTLMIITTCAWTIVVVATPEEVRVPAVLAAIIIFLAGAWTAGARLWFFIRLAVTLLSLGTKDLAWLFRIWHIRSKLRFALMFVDLFTLAISSFLGFAASGLFADLDYAVKKSWIHCPGLLFGWVIYVIAIEKTILQNDLKPNSQLSAPGQAFPLVIGIMSLLELVASWFEDDDD